MDALFARMRDVDRNFIPDFQGAGFHSRLLELATFAYLENADLTIDRSHPFPDFIASQGGVSVALEVVASNPSDGTDPDISLHRLTDLTFDEMVEKSEVEFPGRMKSLLSRKVRRGYHKEAHVAGKPLVIVLGAAHEAGASFYIDELLLPLLYGMDGGENLFAQPELSPISAVLYCNAVSVSRFLRLAGTEHFGHFTSAVRRGDCYVAQRNGELTLMPFAYAIGAEGVPEETWAQGHTLFLNPNAETPLPNRLLPVSSTFAITDGRLEREVAGFHPLWSAMLLRVPPDRS